MWRIGLVIGYLAVLSFKMGSRGGGGVGGLGSIWLGIVVDNRLA